MATGRLCSRLRSVTRSAAAAAPLCSGPSLRLLPRCQRPQSTVAGTAASSSSPVPLSPPPPSASQTPTPLQTLLSLVTSHAAPLPLPSPFFSSAALFSSELRHVHSAHPFFAGCAALHLPSPGSHFTLEVGDVSALVVRGEDGRVRGLFNHCTHQNARLCSSSRPDLALVARGAELRRAISGAGEGTEAPSTASAAPASSASSPPSPPAHHSPFPERPRLQSGPTCSHAERLVCPFHHWTFSLSGEHLAPRTALTQDPQQRRHFALTPVRGTWEAAGLVLLDCARPTPEERDRTHSALWEDSEGEEEWKAVQRRVEGRRLLAGGSLLLDRNWKAAWAGLVGPEEEGRAVGLFPSLVCREVEGRAWLLQLLPLTPQQTAVTAFEVSEGDQKEGASARAASSEWEGEDGPLALAVRRRLGDDDGERPLQLSPRHRALYERWMTRGLTAEVEKEEAARRDYEARRNKVLGLS